MGACSDAKVTVMVLNVDLDCCQCYLKVKKLLCRFPQIRDQVFDEKKNTVTITVICCSPEKIRDKLCSKGGKSIKGIAVKEVSKQKPNEANQQKPADNKSDDKPKAAAGEKESKVQPKQKQQSSDQPEKPKQKAASDHHEPVEKEKEKKKEPSSSGSGDGDAKKSSSDDNPKKQQQHVNVAAAARMQMIEPEAQWVPGYPPPQLYPITSYYQPAAMNYTPALHPPPPTSSYHYMMNNNYSMYTAGQHPCPPPTRADYFSEENPDACSIM